MKKPNSFFLELLSYNPFMDSDANSTETEGFSCKRKKF